MGGYDGMFSRGKYGLGDPFGHAFQKNCQMIAEGPGEPVVFKVELGQAYIAHYNTVH